MSSSSASCGSDNTVNLSIESSSYVSGYKELPFDQCPRCRVQFDYLKRTNNVSSKVPLILNCKHTVCEDCIRKMVITNVPLCPVCREKFTVVKSQLDTITELFTPHFALIGYLLWTRNSPNKGNINWVSTGLTLKSKRSLGIDSAEINSLPDLDKSDDYCEYEEVERPLLSLEFDKCLEHADSSMNIHCENCDKTVCCYCFVESHGGHTPVYLYKLSAVEVSGLQQLKNEMEIVLKQLLQSQMKAKQLKTFELTNVENNIKTAFFNLHAKLHQAEQKMKRSLQNFRLDEADLDLVNSTLKSAVCRVNHVLHLLNTVNTRQINVRALYEEVQELRKIPCCLVSDQGTLDPIEFTFPTDMFEDLEDNFVLKQTSSIEYTLLPIDDWTKFPYDENNVVSMKSDENLLVSYIKCKPEGVELSAPPMHKEKKTSSRKSGSSHEVGRIRVLLTHINGLNSFYIQKLSVQNSLKNMNKYLGSRSKRHLSPDDVIEGRIYGINYETKHSSNWRRGKLVRIKQEYQENVYCIFFIDYGNTSNVTIDKIKELDMHIVKRGRYAIECKLTNPDQTEFDSQAHLRLVNIIGQKELYVQFMKKQVDGVQEVDLLVPSSTGNLVSIRSFLSNTVPACPEIEFVPENIKFFKNSKRFVSGQEDRVKVTYIQDPFTVYVQLAENIDMLEKMMTEMSNYYEHYRPVACVPVEHTDVIVRYEDEYQGNWHRARITLRDSESQEVETFFVDFGKSVTVPWSAVKLLSANFTKIECQAIAVKLADILPENGDEEWPRLATDFLNEQVLLNNDFKMIISNVEPLEVALFQIRPSANICLNSLMVEQSLAISTGNFSQTLYWPTSQEVKMEEEDDNGFLHQLIKKSEEVLFENDDIELKHGLKQQVDVIRFENPELIYVKLVKYKEIDEEMHKELTIHYNAERTTKNSWKPSEFCVIYDSARKQYFRGVIKEANGPDSYQVYLYDHARDVKVKKQFVFVQNLYFKRFLCYVFKCRLSQIKPAGDKGEWSQLAIEMLQKIFSTYKIIHIKKVDINKKQKMIGVRMWYSLTKPAKALEPAKMNFISINKTLIENGVAFSTITATKVSESSGTEGDDKGFTDLDDTSSSKNDTQDWYEIICEEELLKSSSTSWPKVMPLQNREFEAILTCVDSEGIFSIRDEEMHSVYLDMEQNLNNKFNSLKLSQNENMEWKPTEMCTIWYENNWYRGIVNEVLDSDKISVEMIDYGSEHVVSRNHLFKQIMFPDMPPLINKIKLFDVYSKYGQWSEADVNELLQIVTDRVKVVIKGEKNLIVPFAEVYLPSGLSVNDLVIQKCPHLYRCENQVILIPLDEDEDKDKDESCDEERALEDGFELGESSDDIATYTYVPITEGSRMLVVSVLKWASEYKAVLKVLNDNKEDLEFLDAEIERWIEGQPLIGEFGVNEPCAVFYAQRRKWARAFIYEVDNLSHGYVSVFLVDFGIVDMVSIENLKVMKPEWFNFPVYNHLAIISVELVQSTKAEYVLTQLNNLCGKSVKVKILQKDPLRVHLCEGKLVCYQNLITCGILRPLS